MRGKESQEAMKLEEPSPILINSAEAARLVGIDESTWRRYSSAGKVPVPIKLGALNRWCPEELKAWAMHGCPPREEWARIWGIIREKQLDG